jgi:hypothetical protein
MRTKMVAMTVALAVALSATVAWAGAGQRNQARSSCKAAAGICVRQQGPGLNQTRLGQPNGKHYGPGDGTGNLGDGPRDGSGFGKKAGLRSATGTCDGTGPKGKANRTRRPDSRR